MKQEEKGKKDEFTRKGKEKVGNLNEKEGEKKIENCQGRKARGKIRLGLAPFGFFLVSSHDQVWSKTACLNRLSRDSPLPSRLSILPFIGHCYQLQAENLKLLDSPWIPRGK